jgi:hypothetical protein
MGSYVVFSQNRAKPRVARGTKSTRILEDVRAINATADRQVAQKAEGQVPKPAGTLPVRQITMPGSKSGGIFSQSILIGGTDEEEVEPLNLGAEGIAFVGTKSGAPLIPPRMIKLDIPKAKPTPLPLYRPWSAASKYIMSLPHDYLTNAPADSETVGAQKVIPPNPAVQKSSLPLIGSKSMVPILSVRPQAKQESVPEKSK